MHGAVVPPVSVTCVPTEKRTITEESVEQLIHEAYIYIKGLIYSLYATLSSPVGIKGALFFRESVT